MDAKQAKALREPFPAATVGKLPKPYKKESPKGTCRECGGYHGLPAAHLDYVGHAAATDRLLQVDPDWNWEPFALDSNGLPMLDSNRNLWIRLTVAGVTRIGVGDGMGLKECIGDAIRNAAMRFGVALDLWAKEDLQAADVERGVDPAAPSQAEPVAAPAPTRTMSRARPRGPAPVSAPDVAPTSPPAAPVADVRTDAQSRRLFALLRENSLDDREAVLAWLSTLLGRDVDSTKTLTKAEASSAMDALAPEPPEQVAS
ncbi:MAG: hypothetical protein JJE50_01570 [Actinomycetales bacterium]|nr:hypothetical protein [Actinomycetales bacterium]